MSESFVIASCLLWLIQAPSSVGPTPLSHDSVSNAPEVYLNSVRQRRQRKLVRQWALAEPDLTSPIDRERDKKWAQLVGKVKPASYITQKRASTHRCALVSLLNVLCNRVTYNAYSGCLKLTFNWGQCSAIMIRTPQVDSRVHIFRMSDAL